MAYDPGSFKQRKMMAEEMFAALKDELGQDGLTLEDADETVILTHFTELVVQLVQDVNQLRKGEPIFGENQGLLTAEPAT